MAIPLWAVQLALTAASVAANEKYQSDVDAEQSRLVGAELDREAGRQRERDEYLNALLNNFGVDNVKQRTDDAALKRENRIDEVSNMAPANVDDYVGSGSAPVTVSNNIGQLISHYVGKGKKEQKDRARLGAFGDVNVDDSVKIMRTGDDLGMLDDFTRGGQGVLDLETTMAPRYAGRKWKTLSDAAQVGSSAIGWYDIFNAANTAANVGGQSNNIALKNGSTFRQGPKYTGAWGN